MTTVKEGSVYKQCGKCRRTKRGKAAACTNIVVNKGTGQEEVCGGRKHSWRIKYEGRPATDPETGARVRGKPIRETYPSKQEALDRLDELRDQDRRGAIVIRTNLTLGQWLDEWLEGRKPVDASAARRHRGKLSPATWSQYRTYIDTSIRPHLGDVRLQDLTPSHLDHLYDLLEREGGRDGKGLAPKTVTNIHGVLSKALRDAVKKGVVAYSILDRVDPPTAERVRMRWWSPSQLRTFLGHVATDRLYAGWLLFATTGMRRGEVAGLAWEDVDLDAGTVSIEWQLGLVDNKPTFKPRPKSDAGRRVVSLDPATVAALRAWKRTQTEERLAIGPGWVETNTDQYGTSRTGLVFTWQDGRLINPERWTKWFGSHCRAAGLPVIRLHDVRHTYASAGLAAARGWGEVKAISSRLGHANIAITIDTYSHVLPDQDAELATTLADLILNGEEEGDTGTVA